MMNYECVEFLVTVFIELGTYLPILKSSPKSLSLCILQPTTVYRLKTFSYLSNLSYIVRFHFRCHKRCLGKYNKEEQMEMFKSFYEIETKNQQDSFIQSLMEIKPTKQVRPRPGIPDDKRKSKSFSVKYHLSFKGQNTKVCKKSIEVLYSVTPKRLRRISALLFEGKSPQDQRGFNPKAHTMPGEICANIRDHIESFPTKTSHYTKPITYLSNDLNIKIMYNMFKNKFPHLVEKVKYSYYYKYYKENYGYRFGRPQKDVCGQCEEFSAKIKSNTLNENVKRVAVGEKILHLRRAKKFYAALKDIGKKCQNEPDTFGIVFDFMQNLPLPNIPVQEIFYYRQLWVNCFCITDLKTNTSTVYMYHEGIAKKGGNEVASLLVDFLQQHIPKTAKELHIFSDACTGQNRNHTVLRALLGLSMSLKIPIKQYFPVRGHSYLPCDRTFGVIKRAMKKIDRVYTPEQYETLLKNSSDKIKTVLLQNGNIIFDFNKWWPQYFKKNISSNESLRLKKKNQVKFKICDFYYFVLERGTVQAYTHINGLCKNTFDLKQPNVVEVTFPTENALITKNPINSKKIEDIKKVMKYISEDHKTFYDILITWPTTDKVQGDD